MSNTCCSSNTDNISNTSNMSNMGNMSKTSNLRCFAPPKLRWHKKRLQRVSVISKDFMSDVRESNDTLPLFPI